MEEIWKPLPDWEASYEVSNMGRVRRTSTGYIRKPVLNIHGRPILTLTEGKRRSNNYRIHRGVARAFLGEPPENQVPDHINGDRTDNRVINLEWVTLSENIQRSYQLGRKLSGVATQIRRGSQSAASILNEEQVMQIYALKGKMTSKKVSLLMNCSHASVRSIWCGASWSWLTGANKIS